jgi:hypothetical protein
MEQTPASITIMRPLSEILLLLRSTTPKSFADRHPNQDLVLVEPYEATRTYRAPEPLHPQGKVMFLPRTAGKPVPVGRDGRSVILLDHPAVSRLHLVMAFTPEGWKIMDRSSNGSFLYARGAGSGAVPAGPQPASDPQADTWRFPPQQGGGPGAPAPPTVPAMPPSPARPMPPSMPGAPPPGPSFDIDFAPAPPSPAPPAPGPPPPAAAPPPPAAAPPAPPRRGPAEEGMEFDFDFDFDGDNRGGFA